jgi:hypothetical protein
VIGRTRLTHLARLMLLLHHNPGHPRPPKEQAMNLNWKRSLLVLAASLSLATAAAAQAPRITASKGGVRVGISQNGFSASASKGNFNASISKGTRGRWQAPSGYYKNVNERVWVAGQCRQVWVPESYGWIYDNCGRKRWAIVQQGYYQQVQDPGRYEWQVRRIWVSYKTYGNSRGHSQRYRSRGITRRY